MNSYTVFFRSDAECASHDIVAETPAQALAQAKRLYEDDPLTLWFEPYTGMHVNEIAVCDDKGDEVAAWLDEDLRLRLAARDLKAAVEQAVEALNTAPRFQVPGLDTDSYRIASICDKALAKANGGAQ